MADGSGLATGDLISVEKRRYDGTVKYAWEGTVLRADPELLVLRRQAGREQIHPGSGESLVLGSPVLEYHWLNRWFSVFCLFGQDGVFQNYYADIRMPAELEGHRLNYVDLELDLIVHPDLSHEVVDERGFTEAARHQGYPAEVRAGAHTAMAEVLDLLRMGKEPFSSEVLTP